MDFTSALYLGIRHESESLRWNQLTTGTPAILRRVPEAATAAEGLAALVGCERGVLLASTLHAFSDLFGSVGRSGAAILYDEGVYPIARWGMARAETHKVPILAFAHHDPAALE